ncbi:MAG: lysylphosphatidylglycerol synthase transmembrane domain-containing protein [Firmicutes bacterium]|nr:lysylphosphatidylglycerol synthase transmembrane domain-containing protein [Bacillota bacterium]
MNIKKRASTIFNIAIMLLTLVLIVYFMFRESSIDDLARSLSLLNFWWISAACLAMVVNWGMDGYLIYAFTRNSCPAYRFHHGLRTAMVGQYFNSITPFASGGQPMQIYCMSRQGVNAGVAGATMIQKFIVWQSTLTISSFVFLVCRYRFFHAHVSGFMVLALFGFLVQAVVIAFLFLFALNPKLTTTILRGIIWLGTKLHIVRNPEQTSSFIQSQLELFHRESKAILRQKKLMTSTICATVVQYFSTLVVPFCIYRAFGLQGASLFDMLAANSFVSMIVCFFPLPGAAGASEGSFVMLFKMFFQDASCLMPAVLLWRIITYYSAIAFGAPFARISKKSQLEEPQHSDDAA